MWRVWTIGTFGAIGIAQYHGIPIADVYARAVQNSAVAVQKDDAEYFYGGIATVEAALKSAFGVGELENAIEAESETVPNAVMQNGSAETLALLVHRGESKRRGYNDYNRGSTSCRGSNARNIKLVEMTFAQIAAAQALRTCHPEKLLAVGRYQDIDVTRAMRALGIKPFTRYTPAMQDYVFAHYLTQSKQPAVARYIRTGKNLNGAGHAMAAEWASIQSPIKGRGLYDGNGTNKAHIKALRVIEALGRSRAAYIKAINSGLDDKKAYEIAVGVR